MRAPILPACSPPRRRRPGRSASSSRASRRPGTRNRPPSPQGVKATEPDIKIIYAVIGPAAYSDAAGGKRVTEAVIGAGADIIFGQGDGCQLRHAAGGRDHQGDRWRQGLVHRRHRRQDADRQGQPACPRWSGTSTPVYSAMIEDLKADKFGTQDYSIELDGQLGRSCCTPSTSRTMSGPSSRRSAQDIIDGKIKVEPMFDAPKVRALMTRSPTREVRPAVCAAWSRAATSDDRGAARDRAS